MSFETIQKILIYNVFKQNAGPFSIPQLDDAGMLPAAHLEGVKNEMVMLPIATVQIYWNVARRHENIRQRACPKKPILCMKPEGSNFEFVLFYQNFIVDCFLGSPLCNYVVDIRF